MPWTFVTGQAVGNVNGSASVTATYGKPTTKGNILVAALFSSGVALSAASIPGWAVSGNVSFLTAADQTTTFYKLADGTEATITASCTGATTMTMAINEAHPPGQIGVFNVDQVNTASSGIGVTSIAVGSITPNSDDELITACVGLPLGGSSQSWDSGMTNATVTSNLAAAYLLSGTKAAINPTCSWTGASTAGAIIVSIYPGGADTPFRHLRTGDGMSIGEVAN